METVSEENKSLVWVLLKQLRPGMDLSRVALPTFVLEPRSFLNKLSDYYCHADLLSRCAMGRARHPPRGCRASRPLHALPPRGPDSGEGLLGWEGRAAPCPSGPLSQGSLAPSAPEPWHCALRLNEAEVGKGPEGSGAHAQGAR